MGDTIKYIYVAGQRKTLIATFLKKGTFTASYAYFNNNVEPNFIIFRHNLNAEYWVPESEVLRMNKFGEKYLGRRFTESILNKVKLNVNAAWKMVEKLNRLEFSALSNAKLIELFSQINSILLQLMGDLFLSQDFYTKAVEERLISLLSSKFKDRKKVDYYLGILLKDYDLDAIQREEIDWYNYVLNHKNIKREELMSYVLRNGWMIYNAFDYETAYNFILERYRKTENMGEKEIQKRIKNILLNKQKAREEFNAQSEKLTPKMLELATILRDLAKNRLEVKLATNSLEVALNLKLLYFLSKKFNLNFCDLLDGYLPGDIRKLLESGFRVSGDKIKRRKEFVSFVQINGKFDVASGNDAMNKIDNLLSSSRPKKEQKVLKGNVASIGSPSVVTATARIIRLGNDSELREDINRFQKGEIIVTIMTQPNMVPIMKKAAAVITDEGGICSHAAIISREFNIPCIVGTRAATKIIKNGDKVTIDTSEGIVRIIK